MLKFLSRAGRRARLAAAGTLAVACLSGGSLALTASPAYATGTHCAVNVVGMTGPNQYCVTANGSGDYVNYVSGSWWGSAFECNAHITAEFFDSNWHWYQTVEGATINGCVTGSGERINIYATKRTGYVCSTLHYSDGFRNREMSSCVDIHP